MMWSFSLSISRRKMGGTISYCVQVGNKWTFSTFCHGWNRAVDDCARSAIIWHKIPLQPPPHLPSTSPLHLNPASSSPPQHRSYSLKQCEEGVSDFGLGSLLSEMDINYLLERYHFPLRLVLSDDSRYDIQNVFTWTITFILVTHRFGWQGQYQYWGTSCWLTWDRAVKNCW